MKNRSSELKLVEKTEADFLKVVELGGLSGGSKLEDRKLKFFFLELDEKMIGFAILENALNVSKNIRSWILLNIKLRPEYQGLNLGNESLSKIHEMLTSELNVKSYIVSVSNYLTYKMVAKEFNAGVVDFYCPINEQYTFEEMKKEEVYLEQALKEQANLNVDMVVSFNEEETKKVKSIYFSNQ